MTTIAYDGYVLAADTMSQSSFIDQVPFRKIRTFSDCWIAGAGTVGAILQWVDWYRSGADKDDYPYERLNGEDSLGGIFVVSRKTGKLEVWGPSHPYACVEASYGVNALGSGEHFAMGAMLAGANAIEAVKVASKLDPGTGGKVRHVVVRERK